MHLASSRGLACLRLHSLRSPRALAFSSIPPSVSLTSLIGARRRHRPRSSIRTSRRCTLPARIRISLRQHWNRDTRWSVPLRHSGGSLLPCVPQVPHIPDRLLCRICRPTPLMLPMRFRRETHTPTAIRWQCAAGHSRWRTSRMKCSCRS